LASSSQNMKLPTSCPNCPKLLEATTYPFLVELMLKNAYSPLLYH
jgi:hypothetical protein